MNSATVSHQQVALVTGSSRGIGRAIAVALARQGMDIAVNYCRDRQGATETAGRIRELGRAVTIAQADVTDLEAVTNMMNQIHDDLGPVDVLVNNAGVLLEKPLSFMKEEEWDQVMDASLKGAFHCIKAASPGMTRRRYGRIINISSVAGLTGDPMRAAYSAAKAGLLGLTKAMARELAAAGITVNAVTPGIIETEMTANTPEETKARQLKLIPLRRFGQPEEVAELTAFLASYKAGYITGQTFSVDGGLRM